MGTMHISTKTKCCNNECENVDSDDDKTSQIVNPIPVLNDNKREELINLDKPEDSFTTTMPNVSRK